MYRWRLKGRMFGLVDVQLVSAWENTDVVVVDVF